MLPDIPQTSGSGRGASRSIMGSFAAGLALALLAVSSYLGYELPGDFGTPGALLEMAVAAFIGGFALRRVGRKMT